MTRKFLPTLATLQIGDRVIVPKSNIRWIQHHAIYIGFVNGEHRFIENKEGCGVREINASTFFQDVLEITRIERFCPRYNYSRQDLVIYARSLKGRFYNLVSYNCEHVANEIQYRFIKSRQAIVAIGIALVVAIIAVICMIAGKNKKWIINF